MTEAAACNADPLGQFLSNHGTDGDTLLHMQVSLSGGGAIRKFGLHLTHLPCPPLLQVDAAATPMRSDSDAAGPAAGTQGRTGVGGLSGHAGASPAAGSGRSRSRPDHNSGSDSGDGSVRMDMSGTSSGDEGSGGSMSRAPGSSKGNGTGTGTRKKKQKKRGGPFGRHSPPSVGPAVGPAEESATPVAFGLSSPPAPASAARPQSNTAATPPPCPPTGSASPGSGGSMLLSDSVHPSPADTKAKARSPAMWTITLRG